MKFISDTTWETIFAHWREREAHNPGWIKVATEIKGWPDWESWRQHTAAQFDAANRSWQVFAFTDPMNEIPAMLVGPYSGWQSRHPNTNKFTFADLLDVPEQFAYWNAVADMHKLIADFPAPTELIGIIREDTNQIVCLEGHHRATAVALAKHNQTPITFNQLPRIALTTLPENELTMLDTMLKRGSTYKPVV